VKALPAGKVSGILHSGNISGLSKELVLLPHSKRLELSPRRNCTRIHSWILQELHLTINYLRGTPPALVKGGRAPSVRSHGTCTMFHRYPCTPCTLHCRHANPRSWSGVFNLLKFDLTPKKKR